jgi:hypothetical protein
MEAECHQKIARAANIFLFRLYRRICFDGVLEKNCPKRLLSEP